MKEKEISPEELSRLCETAVYDVILNEIRYATRKIQLISDSSAIWPIMQIDMANDSILPLLTATMLGPNKESKEIMVRDTSAHAHTVYAHLTSYMHGQTNTTLRLSVIRASKKSV